MDDLLDEIFDARLVVVGVGPVFLGRFGLGPIADVSRTSSSRGVNEYLWGGKSDVGLGPVPYFALGPIADVSNPTSSSGDYLVLGMRDVNGYFDVRGPEVRDIGEASPCWRAWKRVFGNGISAVNGQVPVSTPSSF